MRKFLVFILIFLLVMVVVADRGLHSAAQNEIAKRVSQRYQLSSEPEVTIGGFPFLTQAIGGEYSEIHIVTGAMTVNDVNLDRVDITARNVQAAIGDLMTEPKVIAGAADAKVMLPYSELQSRLPQGIVIENKDGKPRMTGDLAVPGGISVPVAADLDVSIDGDIINVTPTDIEVSDAPIDLGSAVKDRLTVSFQVPQMPFDLQITKIDALPNGVEVSAEATDVRLVGAASEG
ncbi:DUF2993 domain-containing protein [Nocardiopsis gilva YIM 90087]|uniref:DUF2993 domain-containing protein n=1 Tax=Nocardiopsis gilva YIM 90087 TaxID=1235441 RepID=A0A223S217_9ACTN|nr:DUF2993 domain-containing protein [Nocardiopsis gilva]ASU82164.1 DUF2993 domain-containing protein [Nocardiopsis gilva YIM 90087]